MPSKSSSGPAEVELWLSSNALDTDVFGVLTEIDERGTARALHQTSPFRVRYRDGFNDPKALEPGVPHRVVVPLADFAHLFRPGQRLGLAIRSELFPGAARNLGTMEPYASGKNRSGPGELHSRGTGVSESAAANAFAYCPGRRKDK